MDISIIAKALEAKKITMNELAERCNVGYATIYDLLSEKRTNPTIETLHKITSFLNVSIDELMKGEEDGENCIENKN